MKKFMLNNIKTNLGLTVIMMCVWISVKAQVCPLADLVFTKQSEVDSFIINYPDCYYIGTKLTLTGNDITNLNGFNNLTRVFPGGLHLVNCGSLTSLEGLENVEVLTGLHIIGDGGIDTLKAWPKLEQINLNVKNNTTLKSLSGLNSVKRIWELFLENTILENLEGASGDTIISDLNLKANSRLENVDALINKKWVGRVYIEKNPK